APRSVRTTRPSWVRATQRAAAASVRCLFLRSSASKSSAATGTSMGSSGAPCSIASGVCREWGRYSDIVIVYRLLDYGHNPMVLVPIDGLHLICRYSEWSAFARIKAKLYD